MAQLLFSVIVFSRRSCSLRVVDSRRSGGGLCWRATRQGIAGWRLIRTDERRERRIETAPGFSEHIGWIDFPMPEKTHACCPTTAQLAGCSTDSVLFEFLWWQVTKRRVQPDAVIVALDELLDVSAKIFQVAVSVGVDLFPLESAHEALAAGVVVRIGSSAHAGQHAVAFKQTYILPASILAAAIGVMHQAGQRLPLHDGLLQRRYRQLRRQ